MFPLSLQERPPVWSPDRRSTCACSWCRATNKPWAATPGCCACSGGFRRFCGLGERTRARSWGGTAGSLGQPAGGCRSRGTRAVGACGSGSFFIFQRSPCRARPTLASVRSTNLRSRFVCSYLLRHYF